VRFHDLSGRKAKAFVKLNCAALPKRALMESELFGHEKGAFTGAIAQRIGRLRSSRTGVSVFLDEVGEIPWKYTPKLLRGAPGNANSSASVAARRSDRCAADPRRPIAILKRWRRTEVPFRSLLSASTCFRFESRRSGSVLTTFRCSCVILVQQFGRRMGKTIETIPLRPWTRSCGTTGRATFVNFKRSRTRRHPDAWIRLERGGGRVDESADAIAGTQFRCSEGMQSVLDERSVNTSFERSRKPTG